MANKARKTEGAGGAGDEEDPLMALLAQHEAELGQITDEMEKLDHEEAKEIHTVQKKFGKLRRPIFAKRNAVLKKVPGIWCRILQSHAALNQMITPADVEVLKHVVDLVVEESEDSEDYKILLHFSEKNPFFKNKTVTVDLKHTDEGVEVKCTPIDWLPGKNPIEKKADKGKKRDADENDGLLHFFITNDENPIEKKADKGKKRDADENDGLLHFFITNDEALVQICEMIKTEVYVHPFDDAVDSESDIEFVENENGDDDDDEGQ